ARAAEGRADAASRSRLQEDEEDQEEADENVQDDEEGGHGTCRLRAFAARGKRPGVASRGDEAVRALFGSKSGPKRRPARAKGLKPHANSARREADLTGSRRRR